MSLVRSASPYGSRKIYLLDGSKDNSGVYATESFSNESYDKYFLNSPTEELILPSSSSLDSGNQYRLKRASSYQLLPSHNPFNSSFDRDIDASQSSYELEYLGSQSPEEINFDDDKMRSKLQELERALLEDQNDNDDNVLLGNGQKGMEIDSEWVDQVNDSPKESTSSDSYVSSSISCSKETSPKQLLFECAEAISEGNINEASTMINELRQKVSIQGEPSQRIDAYMLEALAARLATSGKGLYKALKCKIPPSTDRLSAMQVLFEVCPCFRFGFMAANGAILEAFKDEKRVHIIDFDINQGSQYITLLQTLANQPGKRPHLRLTGVDDPESVQRPIGGLKHIGQRLESLAESLDLPFEFNAVAANTTIITPPILNCHPGEAVIVNFAFQLHHMPDESVSTVNQRDQLLRMVKGLNPKLVTVVEQDVNTNTAPFLTRFKEAYNYYSAMFDSLDAALPRDSQERMNVEQQCLARDIVNIVACEGEERIERYEVAGKWRARMMMAGFRSCPVSLDVKESIGKVIKQYSERYKMREEMGGLHFAWEDRVLIVASAWR